MPPAGSRSRWSRIADRVLMTAAVLLASSAVAVLLASCHPMQPSPAAPSPTVSVADSVVVPSVMNVFHAPTGVYGGGDTQIHVGVFGYDGRGNRVRVAGVPVSFRTTSGLLTVLFDRTYGNEDAVALLTVDRANESYEVAVTVEAGTLGATTLRIAVCACLVPPHPAPTPAPTPTPTPPTPGPTPSPGSPSPSPSPSTPSPGGRGQLVPT